MVAASVTKGRIAAGQPANTRINAKAAAALGGVERGNTDSVPPLNKRETLGRYGCRPRGEQQAPVWGSQGIAPDLAAARCSSVTEAWSAK
jgi:hypothetical protein